jgi:hypothetical protein
VTHYTSLLGGEEETLHAYRVMYEYLTVSLNGQ